MSPDLAYYRAQYTEADMWMYEEKRRQGSVYRPG